MNLFPQRASKTPETKPRWRKNLVAFAQKNAQKTAQKTRDKSTVRMLVIAAQKGDQHSLAELHERFRGAIEAAIRKQLGNESDIQEIGQDVSLQVSNSLGTLRNPECIGGWMQTIARRLAIQRIAKRSGQHLIDPHTTTANPVEPTESPLEQLIQKERYEAVHSALSELKVPHRRVLRWFYFDNYSIRQIGQIERIPVGTVKSRLHAARQILAGRLQHLKTA